MELLKQKKNITDAQTIQPAIGFRSKLARILSSFFFVGFVGFIPGTFGSLAALGPYFLLTASDWRVYLGAVIITVAIGIWAAGRAEVDSKTVDPSFVVIDEVAGQLITLFLIPVTWTNVIAAFFLFRFLDVVKPFPGRHAERLPGGFGIMLDDIIVGVYGNIMLHAVLYFGPKIF